MAQYCPQCGTARTGDLRFCASCAHDFGALAERGPAVSVDPLRTHDESLGQGPSGTPPTAVQLSEHHAAKLVGIDSVTFWVFGIVGASIAIIGLGLVLLVAAASSLGLDDWARIETIGMTLAAAFLVPLWVYVTLHEGRMLDGLAKVVEGASAPSEPSSLLRRVLVTVSIVLLLFPASVSPATFGLALAGLKWAESSNAWTAKQRIRELLRKVIERTEGLGTSAEDRDVQLRDEALIHRTYYFSHPWDPLIAGEMLLLILATAAGAYAAGESNLVLKHYASAGATVLILAAVFGNEWWCGRWRALRDRALPVRLGL